MRTKVFGSLSGINLQHSTKKTQQPRNRQQKTFFPTQSHGLVVSSFEMTRSAEDLLRYHFMCVFYNCLFDCCKQTSTFICP